MLFLKVDVVFLQDFGTGIIKRVRFRLHCFLMSFFGLEAKSFYLFFFQAQGKIEVNVTSADLAFRPGSRYTIEACITVPSNCSVLGNIDVSLPVTQSAVMTVEDVRVVRIYMCHV